MIFLSSPVQSSPGGRGGAHIKKKMEGGIIWKGKLFKLFLIIK